MKIINKYKSLFFMSFAAFALFFISTNQATAAVDKVGKTEVVIYDSANQDMNAGPNARLGALLRAGRAVYRAGAYAAGFVVGFVEGVVTGANGDKYHEQIDDLIFIHGDLSVFDK